MNQNLLSKRGSPADGPANADSSPPDDGPVTPVQGDLQWHTMACSLVKTFKDEFDLSFLTSEYAECCKRLNNLARQSLSVFVSEMYLQNMLHKYLCEELLTLHLELMLRYMAALDISLSDIVSDLYDKVQEKS